MPGRTVFQTAGFRGPGSGEDGVGMPHRSALLRHGQLLAVFVLLLQYLAGMAVNLFVKLPDQHPGAGAPAYFGGVGCIVRCSAGPVYAGLPTDLRSRSSKASSPGPENSCLRCSAPGEPP